MTRKDWRHKAPVRLAVLAAMALCPSLLAACGSASAGTAQTGPAAAGSTQGPTATASSSGFHSLPRCTQAQLATATGSVHVLHVISSQTVHVTVGEQVNLAESYVNMRPASRQIQVRAAQDAVCQRADIQGKGNDHSLPLVITAAGSTEISIKAGATPPGGVAHAIIYVNSAG